MNLTFNVFFFCLSVNSSILKLNPSSLKTQHHLNSQGQDLQNKKTISLDSDLSIGRILSSRKYGLNKQIQEELAEINKGIEELSPKQKPNEVHLVTKEDEVVKNRKLSFEKTTKLKKKILNEKKIKERKLKLKREQEKKKNKKKIEKRKLIKQFNKLAPPEQMAEIKATYKKAGINIKQLSNADLKFVIKSSRKLIKFYGKKAQEAALQQQQMGSQPQAQPGMQAQPQDPTNAGQPRITNQFFPNTSPQVGLQTQNQGMNLSPEQEQLVRQYLSQNTPPPPM